jgi:hypothetical protein
MRHETRAALFAVGAGLPAVALALALLWQMDWPVGVRLVSASAVVAALLAGVVQVHALVKAPLNTTASLLQGLRDRPMRATRWARCGPNSTSLPTSSSIVGSPKSRPAH